MSFPKFSGKNLILFISSSLLCFHSIHLPKPAFHPTSFLTTLLKIEAIGPLPADLTNFGLYLFLLHTNQTWLAEVSLANHPGLQERNGRQELLLHTGTNCSPRSACREALTLESWESRVCRCQELLLCHCQSMEGTGTQASPPILETFLNPEDPEEPRRYHPRFSHGGVSSQLLL